MSILDQDYPVISKLFLNFDTRNSGSLSLSNFTKLLRFLDLKAEKQAIKGIFNTFGSYDRDFSVEETINHQLTISEFTNMIKNKISGKF